MCLIYILHWHLLAFFIIIINLLIFAFSKFKVSCSYAMFVIWMKICFFFSFSLLMCWAFLIFSFLPQECHVSCLIWNKAVTFHFPSAYWFFYSKQEMGQCQGCEKLGRMVSGYQFSLLLSPVISFWECIVRKMRYSFRPEWV